MFLATSFSILCIEMFLFMRLILSVLLILFLFSCQNSTRKETLVDDMILLQKAIHFEQNKLIEYSLEIDLDKHKSAELLPLIIDKENLIDSLKKEYKLLEMELKKL